MDAYECNGKHDHDYHSRHGCVACVEAELKAVHAVLDRWIFLYEDRAPEALVADTMALLPKEKQP
jgi:hypothetical protein